MYNKKSEFLLVKMLIAKAINILSSYIWKGSMNNKQAFSFVEVLIAISIIVLLAVISINSSSKYGENRDNSKVVSDLATIDNALESYSSVEWELPTPKWNNNFFKEDSSYAHSYEDSETYGVHGFVTNGTLPSKYMNFLPLDPRTNSFYAYWKTKSNLYELVANQYEIASIIVKDGEAKSKVLGDYTAEIWPFSLIREYNWPDFVYDGSIVNFPYNPEELLITASIRSFTWAVEINWALNNTDKILVQGDKVKVPTGWYAELYFSDGTISTLWDTSKDSELTLSRLVFKQEDNLLTDIKLALSAGSIWSKATHLDNDSEFEVYTTDTSAAVRWTVFWVEKWGSHSNVVVVVWKVEVQGITETEEELADKLDDEVVEIVKTPITGVPDIIDSIIEVAPWGEAEGIMLTEQEVISSTGSLDNISVDIKDVVLWNIWGITNNAWPEILYYENEYGYDWSLKIKLNKMFRKADYLAVRYSGDRGEVILKKRNDWKNSGNGFIVLDKNTQFDNWNIPTGTESIDIAFWKGDRMSKFKTIDISNNATYNQFINDPKFHELSKDIQTNIIGTDFTVFLLTWGEKDISEDIEIGDDWVIVKDSSNLDNNDKLVVKEVNEQEPIIVYDSCSHSTSHGWSKVFWEKNSVTFWNQCTNSLKRTFTCDDGQWKDWSSNANTTKFKFENCVVGADSGTSCDFVVDWIEMCDEELSWMPLYAYAPYNTAGDLDMYLSTGWTGTVQSDSIIWNGTTFSFNCSNQDLLNSFCQISPNNGWIVIDSSGYDDFIEYSNLNITWNFAIEIGVDWSSLNRGVDNISYMLFNSSNSFQFYLKNNELVILWKDSYWNWVWKEDYTLSTYSWIVRISLLYDNWETTLKINGTEIYPDINIIWYNTDLSTINIWSDSAIKKQWNNMIDYVKIYK